MNRTAIDSASRRQFLASSLAVGTSLLTGLPSVHASSSTRKVTLKKAVKFGMIGEGKTVAEKFRCAIECGFPGVEMDSPSNLNVDEIVAAKNETGMIIHGVVNSIHWNIRMSDPDEGMRTKSTEHMMNAMRDCKKFGGTTVLLVPGKVANDTNENYQQVWDRSQAEVKKCLPLAEELGVKIAIEVVWNNFLTKPEQLIEYVDAFKSPYVGAYFDCSNMLRYGVSSADWIRKLGKRMLKFDFKGYSKALATPSNPGKGFGAKVGEGDEDWPEVLKALDEVGYAGEWATAEIGRCNRHSLQDLSARMDKILGLA